MRRHLVIPLLGTVAGLVAGALLATPALADKQAPPPPGKPRDLALPAPRKLTLPNGLRVTLVTTEGLIPKAAVALSVNTGSVDEAADEVWLSQLTSEMMSQGTTSRNAKQIAEDAAVMGSTLEIFMANDEAVVSMDVLSDKVDAAVALVADVIQNPAFPASEIDRLKGDLKRQLALVMSQPGARASEKSMALLFPGHAYGRLYPTPEQIDAFTVDKVRDFFKRGVGPARAQLLVVGRFDPDKAEAAIRDRFGAWTGAETAKRPPAPKMAAMKKKVVFFDRPGAVQSVVQLSTRTVPPAHKDRIAMRVLNTLFGGAFNSRVVRNLREKHGYTYSPRSFVASLVDDGYFQFRADVKTDVTGASLTELYKELDTLGKTPPPADELKNAQAYMAGTFALSTSSRWGLMGLFRQVALYGLPDDYLTTFVQRTMAVTPADIKRLGKSQLAKDRMIVVVEGDPEVVLKQLKPFGTIVREAPSPQAPAAPAPAAGGKVKATSGTR